MTMKAYIKNEMCGRGFARFDDIPEEMFDYLPEMLEDDMNFEDICNSASKEAEFIL